MNPDGTGIKLLDYNESKLNLNVLPTISPNGLKIAYKHRDTLYLSKLRGEAPATITGFDRIGQFSWLHDASKIAFTGFRDVSNEQQAGLFIADADGMNIRFVAEEVNFLGNWSPDGKHILFTAGIQQISIP